MLILLCFKQPVNLSGLPCRFSIVSLVFSGVAPFPKYKKITLDLSLFTTHSTHNYTGIATNNYFFREIEIITPIMHIDWQKKSTPIVYIPVPLFWIKNIHHCILLIMWWKQCDRYFMKWNKNCYSLTNFWPFSCVGTKSRKLLHQFAELIFEGSALEMNWA